MLSKAPFYNSHIKNAIVAFGRVFSGIQIVRADHNDPTKNQLLDIPLNYAPKEKWLVRIEQDPELTNQVYTVLPCMSFEILGYTYDPTRKLNRMGRISRNADPVAPLTEMSVRNEVFTPVPYNLDISLYVLTKTQGDNLQIIEQILPIFTPEYTVNIASMPDLQLSDNLPIILNSVTTQDDYDGDFQTRRFVTTTLSFTLKLNLYSGIASNKIIHTTKTGFHITPTSTNILADNTTAGEIAVSVGTIPGLPTTDTWITNF